MLLLVDPSARRRERFRRALDPDQLVLPTGSSGKAIQRFEVRKPRVVVASLRQDIKHGLALCQELRRRANGERCLFVVHGRPEDSVLAGLLNEKPSAWGVDHFLTSEVDPKLIAILVREALMGPGRRAELPASTGDGRAGQVVSAATPERDPEDKSWKELLTSEANITNIKALLKKDLIKK